MKIKANNGYLERIPGGLSHALVEGLNAGKEMDVDKIPHKLISLVEEVKSKSKSIKEVK
jgi:hypothetical protein